MKRFLPIFLFFLISVQLFAQKKEFEKELYVGVGGGALMSSVDFMPNVLQKQHLGIHGGISAKYITEKHLGLLLVHQNAELPGNSFHDSRLFREKSPVCY